MRVGAIAVRHLVDRGGEEIVADKDIGVFREEAEDQPRHEVVHIMAARGGAPVGIILDQLDIQPVEAAGRADVKGALADLFYGADACQRQEEPEVIGEVRIGAGDGVAGGDVLRLKVSAVGGKDEFRLGLGGCGACFEGLKGLGHLPFSTGLEVNVVGLKNPAKVGFVGRPRAQALDRGVLVAERKEEGIRELISIERLLGQCRYGLFDFNSVHYELSGDQKCIWDL